MIRKASISDLSRIAEILVFNYRLFFYPIFKSDEYYFDELQVPALMKEYAVNEHNADHLWALQKNEKAIRFYERHGFYATGEKKLEEGTTEYLILLKKATSSKTY
ncbi:hypothetical protein SAMN04487770_108135 [Butyrivibrio sp. ob235]|uniref:GNAT family N-acetyltransferase n=1 Tax=Butyrivibrio sp. ob235 TaxID=1761780 RepID=UPI0008AFA71E|nr:GNAT family N-acetyltransferase [Butyrivibrio sp. ob235]SEL31448.1 hypothetical protein SAMN04487770_108135 [Butyrivibrio sp. ob235]